MFSGLWGFLSGQISQGASSIKWNDYNYPPCLSMIHFSPKEDTKNSTDLWKARLFVIPQILIFFLSILNIINNGIQVNGGQPWPRIVLALSYFFLINPLILYHFYSGYKLFLDNIGSALIYYVFSGIIWVIFWIFCVSNILNADGFIRFNQCSALLLQGCKVLSMIEALAYLFLIILQAAIFYFVLRRQ